MKILLTKIASNNKKNMPNYGLAVLDSYLTAYTSWPVDVADTSTYGLDFDGFIQNEVIPSLSEDHLFVGISANTDDYIAMKALYNQLVSLDRDNLHIIIGGPHPTTEPDGVRDFPSAVFVQGEGEKTLIEVIKAHMNDRDMSLIEGISYIKNTQLRTNKSRRFLASEEIPSALWRRKSDLESDFNPIFYMAKRTKPAYTGIIMSSRGCSNNCAFCHKIFGHKVRRRPIPKVIKEIEDAIELGATELAFNDDLLISDHNHFHKLMDEIAAMGHNLPISLWNGVRANVVTETDMKKMWNAGIKHVMVPLESSSVRLQKKMNKGLDPKSIKNAWKMAADVGMMVQTNLIFGYPSATEEELEADIEFILDENMHGATVGLPALNPGHALFHQVCDFDPSVENHWLNYTNMEKRFRNFTTCSDDKFKDLLTRVFEASIKRLIDPVSCERLKYFDLIPNQELVDKGVRFLIYDMDGETLPDADESLELSTAYNTLDPEETLQIEKSKTLYKKLQKALQKLPKDKLLFNTWNYKGNSELTNGSTLIRFDSIKGSFVEFTINSVQTLDSQTRILTIENTRSGDQKSFNILSELVEKILKKINHT